MKKVICILLLCGLVVMSVWASALGEEFTLRNGIHLGDTVEKVLELETFKLERYKNDSEIYGGAYYQGTGKIVNVDNSKVEYFFDKDNRLQEMRYNLLAGMKEGPWGFAKLSDAKTVYDTIVETLTNKYGDPLQIQAGNVSIYAAGETRKQATADGFIENAPKYTSEWLVESDGYYVKIELYLCDSHDVWNRADTYRIFVGYAMISNEKMNEVYQQHVDEVTEQQENLNNDL